MMYNETKWLKEVFENYTNDELSPMVNIGSSTKHFREVEQPHINKNVFAPLEKRGIKIIHSDIKEAEGVDVQCDIYDSDSIEKLKAHNPKSLICNHMFEHVEDRELLASKLMEVIPEGGIFIITVPNSYHYHADPIDTMYRPTPDELAELFPNRQILQKKIIPDTTYWSKIRKRPLIIFRHIFRFPVPFINFTRWKRSMAKLYWLFNRYKVTAIIGRK